MLCKLGCDLVINVLGGLAGGFLILWVIERHRRPALFMKPHVPKKSEYKILKKQKRDLPVEVHNKETPRFVRPFYDREPAYQCLAWLTFHRCHENRSLLLPEDFIGRWTAAQKPSFNGKMGGEQRAFDIPVDEYARVDVVARLKGDEACYVWNNESFRGPEAFRAPRRRLCKGRHLVRLRVKTAGREWFEIFWLRNDGAYEDSTLEPVDEDDPLRRIPLNRWPRP